MAEWHKNLQYLKRILLRIPEPSPIATDVMANTMNYPIIVKGVDASKTKSFLKPYTVWNSMILTMSLKTPSPYTIEKSLG
jgi:hypothetical protein